LDPGVLVLTAVPEDKYTDVEIACMGAIGTCPCGWAIVSPLGVEDVKKYAMMHMKEHHPETVVTPEELMAYIKQV